MPAGPMRIALADDSAHFRGALEELLRVLGADVVAAVGSGPELDPVLDAGVALDVVVVDMRMPPTWSDEGVRTARRIRAARPGLPVLVLSADDEAPHAADLLTGAPPGTGYLLKASVTSHGVLRDALDRLLAGEVVVDPGIQPAR